jgi:hypothetical protein
MKSFILSGLVCLALTQNAFAAPKKLDYLNCHASNGLELSFDSYTKKIETKLGYFEKTFTIGAVSELGSGLRISLSEESKANNNYAYDIMLYNRPEAHKREEITGVIGSSFYEVMNPIPVLLPSLPLPASFVVIATITCETELAN